jgi:hypothetical protein
MTVTNLPKGLPSSITDMFHGAEVPALMHVPEPERYYIAVAQYKIKKRVGSILLPDSAVDAQGWTHGLAVVLKVGPCAFKGRKMEDLGLSPDNAPQVGDIVCYTARVVPSRLKVDGIDVMYIPDDAPYARVSPEMAPHISFNF